MTLCKREGVAKRKLGWHGKEVMSHSHANGLWTCHASDDASAHQLNDRPLFLLSSLASGSRPTCILFFLNDFSLSVVLMTFACFADNLS